jgi:hypothetical protein
MASPFARSLRSLEADKFSVSLIMTGVSVVIITIWLLWFFLARVTVYVDSNVFSVERTGYVTATFPTDDINDIRQGQTALVVLDGELGEQLGILEASVYQIDRGTNETDIELFVPYYGNTLAEVDDLPSGRVRIEVETATPLDLIMRAIGRGDGNDTPGFVSSQ